MVFEPEEVVGRAWNRLVSGVASYRHHTEAAVRLEDVQGMLQVLFRALGGDKGIRIVSAAEADARHRLGLRQRIGIGSERMALAALDGETLRLPPVFDVFPTRADNAALYEWIAAWFAHVRDPSPRPTDPLQADVAALRHAALVTQDVISVWPGLRTVHAHLAHLLLGLRPDRARGAWERQVEQTVRDLLTDPDNDRGSLLDRSISIGHFEAPRGYRPFLPLPLWGMVLPTGALGASRPANQDAGPAGESATVKRRDATRRPKQTPRRHEPLVLYRFEALISASEKVDLDRDVDDDEAATAKQAADDLDEITLAEHERRPAASLRLDLDLPSEVSDPDPLAGTLTYPEWDHRRRIWHLNQCRVVAETAPDEGAPWVADEAMLRRIRQVRRHFEALRPRRAILTAQADGDELDLSALVRARADLRAGNAASDRVYLATRETERDLAVALLVDVSLSTDSSIEEHRVLDVEKEAVVALTQGLRACGDAHAVFTFTSRRRTWVSVRTVKDFHEPLNLAVLRRVQAMRPGYYTRMGAAIRHVSARLQEQPNRHRLLLLLTDGKPNDIDYYEGRYGVEDTRMAIREARRRGLTVFGITVDEHAYDYFPYIFGRGAYTIFPHIARLTAALPAIYRQIAA